MKKIFLLTAVLAFVASVSFAQKKMPNHRKHHRHHMHHHHAKKMAEDKKM